MICKQVVFTAGESITSGFAASISREAERYSSELHVVSGGRKLQLSSLISILAMELKYGEAVQVMAHGEDEEKAAEAICALLRGE